LEEGGFTINTLSQNDGIINSFSPIFTINPMDFENLAGIIYRLIQMTKSFLRESEGLTFEIVYPQSSDTYNETYYSFQAPYFKEYTEKSNLLIPNSIVVFCNVGDDGNYSPDTMITGTAKDTDSINFYEEEVIEYHLAPFISTLGDANNRASAILQRYKYEVLAGRLVLPFHDCRVELYDRIQVVDSRKG
jgi:hypothetical protein